MTKYNYTSIFAPYFNSFIKMKAALGFKTTSIEFMLKEFDEVYKEMPLQEPILTKEIVRTWRESRLNDSERTLYFKWSVINQFSRYMCHCGFVCYIPQMPKLKNKVFTTKIFSHDEIQRIFFAADNLSFISRHPNLSLFPIPTLFRVLYATGMRIGEVINLNNEDINFEKKTILVNKSKNHRQRIIPITPSLNLLLHQYLQYRDKMPIKNVNLKENPLFISNSGSRIQPSPVYAWFKKTLKLCNIPFLGGRQGPRIHDLRHTFAVHALMKQVKDGKDMYCLLPILSVFMGHKSISGTEYYVRLTSEMFPELNMQISEISSYIFPSLEKIVNENEDE